MANTTNHDSYYRVWIFARFSVECRDLDYSFISNTMS